ncbi:uncharacterized protein cubi_00388 [Cryptosporidium ubiquitum]|uniref:Uncharacterized protein n=1 Tax=Cryptosporidium ubiquitum TaxID=857276 RepID=A0A1J4MDV1_9CRYT|nr:uncharacterized protein cubi_00388 [Cryptosporidium ubiquitum]OII72393.1 hypothetical protein cubi_00388 [Cryptosporidium ubiquitum]
MRLVNFLFITILLISIANFVPSINKGSNLQVRDLSLLQVRVPGCLRGFLCCCSSSNDEELDLEATRNGQSTREPVSTVSFVGSNGLMLINHGFDPEETNAESDSSSCCCCSSSSKSSSSSSSHSGKLEFPQNGELSFEPETSTFRGFTLTMTVRPPSPPVETDPEDDNSDDS